MKLGIFDTFPDQRNPDIIMNIVFMFLFSAILMACLTFIFTIPKDIQTKLTIQK